MGLHGSEDTRDYLKIRWWEGLSRLSPSLRICRQLIVAGEGEMFSSFGGVATSKDTMLL